MRDMPNLDVVRSLAVLSVVMEHFLLGFGVNRVGPFEVNSFGVLGVLVFFVLTSLVLMWSLERKPHTLDFYIRRVFRIYPLAIAALAVVVCFHARVSGTATDMFAYAPQTAKSFLAQATLLPGVDISAMTVMWSLPYEVGMYLLLPMLFFYLRRNFSLWPMFVLWGLTVFVTRKTPSETHNFGVAIAYFLPGLMAYVGFHRWKPVLAGWMLPPFLALLWAAFWFHFSFHRGWVFCLIVGLMLPLFRQIRSELVLTPSRLIARYSYGIYLTHPFVVVLSVRDLAGWPLVARVGVSVAALVVLPVAAYHLLEQPMIRLGSKLANRAEKKYEQHEYAEVRQPLTQ